MKPGWGPSPLAGLSPGMIQWMCGPCYRRSKINMASKMQAAWDRDNIQFPRLLAELASAGLTTHQYRMLEDSMDLTTDDINELLERAEKRWNVIKARTLTPRQFRRRRP